MKCVGQVGEDIGEVVNRDQGMSYPQHTWTGTDFTDPKFSTTTAV